MTLTHGHRSAIRKSEVGTAGLAGSAYYEKAGVKTRQP